MLDGPSPIDPNPGNNSMKTRLTAPLLLMLGLVLAITGPGFGQCFPGDDGFDTGCCAPVAPNLPAFPPLTVTSEYGALLGCHPTFVVAPFPVQLSAPTFVLCDIALINVNAQITASENVSGMLIAKYSRTWMDYSSPIAGQVWRFLVNGDLTCSSSNPITPCGTILPRCAALGNPVHFDGHIDYSCDPLNYPNKVASFSLNHIQGCISHAPWSAVPLAGTVGHNEVSYHIVGPAPFSFGTGFAAPQGLMAGEAVRSSYLRLIGGFVYQCGSEAKEANIPGTGFILTATPTHCGCPAAPACPGVPVLCTTPPGGCFAEQTIQGLTCCPTPSNPYAGFPLGGTPISNTGFLSQTIGTWGSGAGYPYGGNLTIYFGVMGYTDPCAKANWNLNAVVGAGVSNVFGQPFNTTTCGPPAGFTQTFIDLQNVLLLSSPFLPQGYGSLSAADLVWNIDL
jgi:hypothetical protein